MDLGCGTGDLTLMLAQSGYDMIGVDRSEEMLAAEGPYLLDIHTGYDEHVLPMIPPGGDYTAIIME